MSEIGRQVGCTRENVRQLLCDTGHYKNGCRLDKNKALILELRKMGHTQREAAERLGCSAAGIYYALKRWGEGRGRVINKRSKQRGGEEYAG